MKREHLEHLRSLNRLPKISAGPEGILSSPDRKVGVLSGTGEAKSECPDSSSLF